MTAEVIGSKPEQRNCVFVKINESTYLKHLKWSFNLK